MTLCLFAVLPELQRAMWWWHMQDELHASGQQQPRQQTAMHGNLAQWHITLCVALWHGLDTIFQAEVDTSRRPCRYLTDLRHAGRRYRG